MYDYAAAQSIASLLNIDLFFAGIDALVFY